MENNIIKFNTYKLERGGLLYDMYDQFNARVGDQGTPFVMQWLQGLADTEVDLQAQKLHFYATGQVGKYLEKLKDGTGYQMSADASQVEYEDRNAAGTMDHGITKVKLPKQFFPQEGIFYGYFGLKDDQGNTYTSVNVWFRVLGGVPIMGAAIPYFSTRFDELMETCKGRIEDVLAQLRQEYQDEVKKNEDMSAETRAALEKLASSVGAIQAQIDAGNVITRKEYLELANKIENTLAKMDFKPETFENEAALRAKYPNGVAGELKVTADIGHKWLYINGAWKDCGQYQAAGLPDTVMSRLGDIQTNLITNGSFTNGKTSPATAVTAIDKFDIISDLGKNWVRLGTNGKIVQFVGANAPVTMYDINAYYTMHLQFDAQSSMAMSLAVQVIYLDNAGKTIDTQRIDTVTLDKWAPFHADLYFRFISDSYKKASSVQIRVVDTQAEAIDQLTFTGFKLNAIYNSQKNTNMNLIENGDFANRLTSPATPITPVDNYSVTYDLNRNWLTLGTNQKNVKYVGAEIPIREYGTLMYYRAHLQLDIQAMQKLDSVSIQVAYYNDKGLIDVQSLTNFALAANTPSHISKVFNWDMNLFKQATRLALRVVDTNEEAIGSLMLTGISIVPLYKGQNTYSKNLINNGNFDEGLTDSSVALSGDPVTYITRDYLGRSWLQLSTNGKPAQFVGARFPFIKGDVLNFYKMRLRFDAECSLATTLAVQVAYLDDKDTQIAVDSFKPLKLNKYQLTHYNTVFTLTSDSYAKASKLEVRIVDNNTEVIDALMLTGLELTVVYAGDSDGASANSDVTTIKSSLPVIQLSGDVNGMSGSQYKLLSFKLIDGTRTVSGYANTKWQGDSSLSYPKKAYRIKTFEDEAMTKKLSFKPNPEWGAGSKWNLKAYYTDSLLGRDAVNAKIGGAIWATEKSIPQQLIGTNNFGFIDGFPILVYVNGEFNGVYSFNIPKGDYGSGVTAIEGAKYTDATKYTKLPEGGVKLDGTDFDMVAPDEASDEIKKQINDLITFVSTSSDDDFKAKLNDYLDKESAIDYWIFCHLIDDGDAWGKNQQLLTYDGKRFFIHPYDLDVSYGNQYDGSLTGGHDNLLMPDNLLFKRLATLFATDIKKRYAELRSWLTPTYVLDQYRHWVSAVGEDNYEKEYQKWGNDKSDFNYLKSQVYKAFKICDQAWID